jgi:hypothetical protein
MDGDDPDVREHCHCASYDPMGLPSPKSPFKIGRCQNQIRPQEVKTLKQVSTPTEATLLLPLGMKGGLLRRESGSVADRLGGAGAGRSGGQDIGLSRTIVGRPAAEGRDRAVAGPIATSHASMKSPRRWIPNSPSKYSR